MALVKFVNNQAPYLNAENLNNNFNYLNENISNLNEIIDKKITEDNNYIKFDNGTLICYGKTNSASIAYGSEYSETITLPESYIDNKFIVLTSITSGGASWANVICRGGATSENTIRLIAGNYIVSGSTARDIILSYITIGRWK